MFFQKYPEITKLLFEILEKWDSGKYIDNDSKTHRLNSEIAKLSFEILDTSRKYVPSVQIFLKEHGFFDEEFQTKCSDIELDTKAHSIVHFANRGMDDLCTVLYWILFFCFGI